MKRLTCHKKSFAVIVTILIAGFLLIGLLTSKFSLTLTTYQITSEKIDSSIRIVQITDLHNSEFGVDNQKLVEMVKEQYPDVILITGDLLDSGVQSTSVAEKLISDLCEICPVYISYGNHEYEYETAYNVDLTSLYESARVSQGLKNNGLPEDTIEVLR